MLIGEFVEDLNVILKIEYGAVMQYILHVHRLSRAGLGERANQLLVLANDEIRHAEALSEKIMDLGGKPVLGAEWDSGQNDLDAMLRINFATEQKSIKVYERLIAVADFREFKGLKKMLKAQLEDEIKHVKLLQNFLKEWDM